VRLGLATWARVCLTSGVAARPSPDFAVRRCPRKRAPLISLPRSTWVLILAATVCSTGFARAQGTNNVVVTILPPDARSEAMAGAPAALATDAFATWGNVGGLAYCGQASLVGSRAQLVPDLADDVYLHYGAVAASLHEGRHRVALGFSLARLGYHDLVGCCPGARSSADVAEEPTHDQAVGVSTGIQLFRQLAVGVGIKSIKVDDGPIARSSGYDDLYHGAAVDFGIYGESPLGVGTPGAASARAGTTWLYGLALQNAGPALRSSFPGGYRAALSRTLRAATGLRFGRERGRHRPRFDGSVAFSIEKLYVTPPDPPDSTVTYSWFDRHNVTVHGGAELRLGGLLALRGGYLFDDPAEIKGWTYGAGLALRERIGVDVASIPQYTELSRVTKFSAWVRLPFAAER
jgi:hypothetical protein